MLIDTSGMLSAQFRLKETLQDSLVSSRNKWGEKRQVETSESYQRLTTNEFYLDPDSNRA